MRRELNRFRTSSGTPLTAITRRLAAIDARDGRAVAATSDVDTQYRVGDQLHVQPDAKLAACFDADEPVRMSRQEVAVARSHIEAWKAIKDGTEEYVLVLEDDTWFRRGAAATIERGWLAALRHSRDQGGPKLLYLSYSDAGGSAERIDLGNELFRPLRGLWFLSGYVLSRLGAETLLRAMPVKGPVDMWMNYQFEAIGALALSEPAILQRRDAGSDNAYSILPYLARAGTIDASSAVLPSDRRHVGPVMAWAARGDHEGLAMALSMLGLRVRVFDGDEAPLSAWNFARLFDTFDAVVDAPASPDVISSAFFKLGAKLILEEKVVSPVAEPGRLRPPQIVVLRSDERGDIKWKPLCAILDLPEPAEPFPIGAPSADRLFRDDRSDMREPTTGLSRQSHPMDESPWVLPPGRRWCPMSAPLAQRRAAGQCLAWESMTAPPSAFRTLTETFPGNLATFTGGGLVHGEEGARLVLSRVRSGARPYASGAFASVHAFAYGRFEADIKAAAGPGVVTGFFLHRDTPRQEIDVEITGVDPTRMLVNVYFNPGDEGTTMAFGYRGSPYRVDLGFDATKGSHRYAVEWRPEGITWLVDDRIVHQRVSWDPTPIPHLPMRLYGNLWAPQSEELAGCIADVLLPATAIFRDLSVLG